MRGHQEMAISKKEELEVLTRYHVAKESINKISKELNRSRNAVRRVILRGAEPTTSLKGRRKRLVDEYIDFVTAKLQVHPSIPAIRLFHMVKEQGYTGGESQFRALVAEMRPKAHKEAYLKLNAFSGEYAQVDWAEFGAVTCENSQRKLYALFTTLAYSRALHVTFSYSMRMPYLLEAQRRAFVWLGGVPRKCLYDNMKSVVLARVGRHAQMNDELLEFAKKYRFLVEVTGVRKPNEKGRVERSIQYFRGSFFDHRDSTYGQGLEKLNEQALHWCNTISLERKWPDDVRYSVGQKLEEERRLLTPIPPDPYPYEDIVTVQAGKTIYVRFDTNDYSIPPSAVGKSLKVMATSETVRIVDTTTIIATHKRSFAKGKIYTESLHVENLLNIKRAAARDTATRLLIERAPNVALLLEKLHAVKRLTVKCITDLQQDLDLYGIHDFDAALSHILRHGPLQGSAVRRILEEQRAQRGLDPILPLVAKK
jgi:transposase